MSKTLLSRIIAFFMVIIFLFAQASPAFADGGRSITLLEVIHRDGKGLIFKFAVTGEWTQAELDAGYLLVDGVEYSLDCNFSDDGTMLICVAESGSGGQAGKAGWVVFDGQGIAYEVIPQKNNENFCYPVWGVQFNIENIMIGEGLSEEAALIALQEELDDIMDTGDGEDMAMFVFYLMDEDYMTPISVGNYCSESEPETGDTIFFVHPDEQITDVFYFIFEDICGPGCLDELEGDLPAIFIGEPDTIVPDSCAIDIPAYHGIGSIFYTFVDCGIGPFPF